MQMPADEQKLKLVQELSAATDFLQQSVAAFNDQNLYATPAMGGWSAGEVLTHLLMLETSIGKMLQIAGAAAQRDFRQKEGIIINGLADNQSKYSAPEKFVPSKNLKQKQFLLDKVAAVRNMLTNLVLTLDITEMVPDFKHPLMGRFTRYEWILFVIHHSNRHAGQIESIKQTVLAL